MAEDPNAEVKQVPKADPQKSYVSSWIASAVGALMQALSQNIDDIERDFGRKTYEDMLNDSAAGGSIDILRTAILEPGLAIVPSVEAPKAWKKDAKKQTEYEKASEVCEFVKSCLDPLELGEASLDDVVYEMLLSMAFGTSIGELLFIANGSRYVLSDIIVKPRQNMQMVVNESNVVVGLNVKKVGESSLIQLSTVVDASSLIDRDKFAILTFGSRNRDPRGSSVFRRAYGAWYIKTQVWPAFFKYLLQFGTPSLAGFTPEGDTAGVRDDAGKEISPEEAMAKTLAAFFQNGSAVAFKGGSDLKLIQSAGEGQAFQRGIDLFNQEITRAILLQTRATMEAQHGSKADSETSQDILDVLVLRLRSWVCRFVRREILARIVKVNLGEAALKYTPKAVLAKPKEADFAAIAGGLASLKQAGWFDFAEDMLPEADEMLGFTPRDMTAYRTAVEIDQEAKALQSKEMGRLFDPTSQDQPPKD